MSELTDPEILEFVRVSEDSYPIDANVASPEEDRRLYRLMFALFELPRPDDVASGDTFIAAAGPTRQIPVRYYSSARADCPSAAILYLHGGGFVVGDLESHDPTCARLCAETGLDVISVDYRLCPEQAYPAALDDVEAAYRHLALSYDRIVVMGDSAGGNLTAALCRRLFRLGEPQPAGQVLIYPFLGGPQDRGSFIERADAPLLRASDCQHYRQLYAGGDAAALQHDPEFMPLSADDYRGLATAFAVSADLDPLRDDARLYVERLRAAGVAAEWRNEPQLVHGYLRAISMSRRARASFAAICEMARAFADQLSPIRSGSPQLQKIS